MSVPIKFVILSQPRTGSTLTTSLFNSVKGVRAMVEPINPTTHHHHMKPMAGSTTIFPEMMVQDNIERVLELAFRRRPPPSNIVSNSPKDAPLAAGFKIMAHQIMALRSEPDFWKYLREHDVKTVIVFRNNILMQYVSDQITRKTRQPACWDGKVKTAKVKIPINTLDQNLRRIIIEKQYLLRKVEENGLSCRKLRYEDFKSSLQPIISTLDWLLGQKVTVVSRLAKQNPDSLRARVQNYDELVAHVHRLNFGHLLVDT